MRSWDTTKRRVDNLADKIWQLNQGNETKTQNLEKDWDDLAARAKKNGWSKDEDNPRAWIERQSNEGAPINILCDEVKAWCLCGNPKMTAAILHKEVAA